MLSFILSLLTFTKKKMGMFFFSVFFWFGGLYMMKYKTCYFFFKLGFLNLFFMFDFYSMIFFFLLIYIGGMIILYSNWYMITEKGKNIFIAYMCLFIFFMFILTTTQNLILLFIGWEGVGVMSFFLIGWWYGRSEATMNASQAMFYNRLGDFCFLVLIINTFCDSFFFSSNIILSNINFFFIMLAVFAKSSQFFFHPWLPNAMEGPTPVSSLLHSSTMVVAGVYLLLRVNLLSPLHFSLPIIGGLTMLFMGISSVYQSDIKKVIAYSTSSQLGFMIFTIFFVSGNMGFFLLFTHAFFKSLLFLVSGLFIHGNNNNQSMQNMYMIKRSSSLGSFIFSISAFSLMGLPFLSGFFSKDMIIENLWSSVFNSFIILLFVFGCIFTVIYSLLLVNFSFGMMTRKNIGQEIFNFLFMWMPMLFFGAVFFGFFFSYNFSLFGEFYFLLVFYYVPVMVLFLGGVFFFFFKKILWGGYGKYTFFYSPLMHSLLSKSLTKMNSYVILLDYFFFENIYFFLKNLFLFLFFLFLIFLDMGNFFFFNNLCYHYKFYIMV
uniref:NADH:ubiquinone reductase (H(+)-translocating) n=1 Tax=Diplosoma listerianum TaxID=168635 RepID=D1GL04_9ASCI|nr:NADH dehydrogenase subunit 5 [Diplosoma listerianum]